jgi:2-polyprenyl-3-methyl-5-hydroxy-6-metoxy-1,4-benzoquinol methylase
MENRNNIKNIENKFLSILESLNHPEYKSIKKFKSYRFIKKAVTSKAAMLRYFDLKIGDIRYVKNTIENSVVVDAGCGAGMFSVLLSLLGAKKVYAVDCIADCVRMTRSLVSIAHIDNIEVIHSDIGTLDLPAGSIDSIFCIEAISHYKDYKSFLTMASIVLKKGGLLFIRDGNNAASPFVRKKNYKIWAMFENYPKATTIFGIEKDERCFSRIRKEIIELEFPTLSQTQAESFARYTFGYSREKIVTAVRQFIKGDFFLKSEFSYGKCPLNPEKDYYMEYLFNPIDLKHELRNYGFKSKVIARGPARRKLKLLRFVWELLSPLTIFLPGGFQLIAKRL